MKYLFIGTSGLGLEDLKVFFKENDPANLLQKFTGKNFIQKQIKIVNVNSGKMASWLDGKSVGVDFKEGTNYVWLCSCHEMAHILLWVSPRWDSQAQTVKILSKNQKYVSKDSYYLKYGYDFRYAVEQTLAFLLQAACENEAGLRKLQWEEWESTFRENGVLEFGKIFWKPWVQYLKNLSSSSKIDKFIFQVLENNY